MQAHPLPRRHLARLFAAPLAALLALALAACGGGGGSAPPPAASEIYIPANAWPGATAPVDAEVIESDAFQAAVSSGELSLARPDAAALALAARDRQAQADLAALRAVAAPGPGLADLLAEASVPGVDLGDTTVAETAAHPAVMLRGLAGSLRDAADARQRLAQPDNALAVYEQLLGLLPAAAQAGLATPASLVGQPMAAIDTALAALDARRQQLPRPAGARHDGRARSADGRQGALAIGGVNPGDGWDSDGCRAPRGLFKTHWFPLKYFLSPVKSQGVRNTCWAFTAIGAMESREQVQNGQVANLSEQFLVNKVKEHWAPDAAADTFHIAAALDLATAHGQIIPPESFWTYNPGYGRVAASSQSDYTGVCRNYRLRPPTGTCSESTHQSGEVCTFVNRQVYCAYRRVNYSGGPGVAPAKTRVVWSNGDTFYIERLRALLDGGVVLMADMPVYRGFTELDPAKVGVLTVTDKTHYDAKKGMYVSGPQGRHAVQIVGFLDNEQLAVPGQPPFDIPGGGYFIVKNSWGCGFGDAGYAYIPAAVVQQQFMSLSVIEFGARRSNAWDAEQAVPGGLVAPEVGEVGESHLADLRVSLDLAEFFEVTHPDALSVRVTVTSDVEGVIYDGPWITDRTVFGGTALPHTFEASGRHLLGIVARYGSSTSFRLGITVDVRNSPPTLVLQASGSARVGEPYAIAAVMADINEPRAQLLCDNASWTVNEPDVLAQPVAGSNGCAQRVVFGATGLRNVTVSTHDREGQAVQKTLAVTVEPAAANPYPRILGANVLSREFAGVPLRTCRDVEVTGGSTIDLRELGCTPDGLQTPPARYTAHVTVENPSAEALSYEWNLYATVGGVESNVFNGRLASTTDTTVIPSQGNQTPVTNDCRLTVTVIAPDPARNKSQTVWSGRCTYLVGRIS